jgi:hypothetical protein
MLFLKGQNVSKVIVISACLTLLVPACSDDTSNTDGGSGNDGGVTNPVTCTGTACTIQGNILSDVTLKGANQYLIKGGVFVGNDSDKTPTLTIEAGTVIKGDQATKAMLVIQRGAKIMAIGTKDKPIVFTSAKSVGSRARGDWGGIIINGKATNNRCPATGDCNIKGEGGTGTFGGTNDSDNSGTMKYVRIEFAGRLIDEKNELNGLALQGVGSGTTLEYIQVHMGQDDGIEFFGGTARIKHLVITGSDDDNLDWTDGWRGKGQFIIVQQYKDAGDNGIEADNLEDNNKATPRSKPMLSNMTFVGSPQASTSDMGALLRRGTGANIYNTIFTAFNDACFDLDDDETFTNAWDGQTSSNITGQLTVDSTIFNCTTNFKEKSGDKWSIKTFVMTKNKLNKEADPKLTAPTNEASPDFSPASGSPAVGSGVATQPSDSWFDSVDYIGAIKDSASDWTKGWTNYAQK